MDIEEVFPEIETIADDSLRTGVSTAWTTAAGINGLEVEELPEVPWLPATQRELDIEAEEALLVDHVRDVASCAVGLAESLLSRDDDLEVDLDTVIAGALVHDVSKLYEFDGMERTEVGELLGHPYYGVAVVSRANLPVEIAHVVLSHSSRTTVEPATLEAEIVRRADEVAAAKLRAGAVDDLREA
ncbi:HD domain-containing protein [Natronomonas salina]|uniref:HD domain-containing protein n=1 Tax=Natronomonas salina TaxID=1710540 RepID=UPI0015B431D1|nr:HD domain-containing protein [Natronomonas salina]QLD90731.1 HD domain-containing protein [Natronomonas salina]